MTETMTIDEVIAKIRAAHGDSPALCQREYNEGLDDAVIIFLNNRAALEAGCRGLLRCEVCEYKWDEKKSCAPYYDTYYQAYPLKTDGKYAGFWCCRADTAQKARDKLRVKVESIGLTPVFVDKDGEETSDE